MSSSEAHSEVTLERIAAWHDLEAVFHDSFQKPSEAAFHRQCAALLRSAKQESASSNQLTSVPDAHGLVHEAWTSPSESQVRFEIIKQFKRGHHPMISRVPVDELYLYVSGIIQALERAQDMSYGRDLQSGNEEPK